MSEESIARLKYALALGWKSLGLAADTFDDMIGCGNFEQNKYFHMCEELAEKTGIPLDQLISLF